MSKKQTKGSLADKIAGVLSALPAQFNPDDDQIDDTSAKVEFDDSNDEIDDDEELISKFRKHNIDLLADVDKKYAGKKASRKKSEDTSEYSENDASEDQDSEEESIADSAEQDLDEAVDEDDSEDENDDLEQSDSDKSIALSEENDGFQHIRESNNSQVKKGVCVRNQMSIWENLLEVRIQMQKMLLSANQLPQASYYKEMMQHNDPDLNLKEKVNETKNSVKKVLDKLLILQNLSIKKFPETKNLGKKSNQKPGGESDEEIPSDTDDQVDSEEEIESKSPKRRKLIDYEKDISDLHNKYKAYRNDTIEKWNTKTRLSIMKNSGQAQSVVNHIEHCLTDVKKLRKRTQLKRSEYRILGEQEKGPQNDTNTKNNEDVKQVEDYNSNIFDDNDFYHHLLRELIEVKSSDITDPVLLGRQWIQLQNLRSKMKRKIDTRATKGRKIRYAIHSKLVNFMAPFDDHLWTEEAKNELFSSLFGKIQSKIV